MNTLVRNLGVAALSLLVTAMSAQDNRSKASQSSPSTLFFAETGQQLNRLASRGVALGDLNGDGFLDAFVVNETTPDGQGNRVYFGDGKGRLTDSGQELVDPSKWEGRPAIGDVNGDGYLDVITGQMVWLNNGQGHFATHPALIEAMGANLNGPVGLADLNGDGSQDLVAVSDWKQLRIYSNDGKGHLRDTGQKLGSGIVGSMVLGDVNGDGAIDILSAGWKTEGSEYCPTRVWVNDGKGQFSDGGSIYQGKNHVHGIALGNLNGDGSLDVVLAFTAPGEAGKVFLNDGKGHFHDSGQILAHSWAHGVSLGDLDGDGALDVFFACGEPKTGTPNEVWLNDGEGNFRDSGLRLGNAFSWDVALGDLNGDRKLDAVVGNLRIAGGTDNQPVFGGVPLEVWLNTSGVKPLSGAYLGQPLPGAVPEVFALGIVSTDANEHSAPSFSPDGNEVFWWANQYPDEKHLSSMTMRQESGRWTSPQVTPFGLMAAFSPDGRHAYYCAQPPRSSTASEGQPNLDIWVVEKQGDAWGEPKCLNLVARFPELREAAMPRVTRSGTIYFLGYAQGTKSDRGIYRSELVNGEYAKPELLPRCINLPPFINWAPFIAPDESYLLFSSNRTGSLDKYGDIYISHRLADGGWTEPVSLGAPINTQRQEVFPGLSPDGKYLFFCRDTPHRKNEVYWVNAASIPALTGTSSAPQEASQ